MYYRSSRVYRYKIYKRRDFHTRPGDTASSRSRAHAAAGSRVLCAVVARAFPRTPRRGWKPIVDIVTIKSVATTTEYNAKITETGKSPDGGARRTMGRITTTTVVIRARRETRTSRVSRIYYHTRKYATVSFFFASSPPFVRSSYARAEYSIWDNG